MARGEEVVDEPKWQLPDAARLQAAPFSRSLQFLNGNQASSEFVCCTAFISVEGCRAFHMQARAGRGRAGPVSSTDAGQSRWDCTEYMLAPAEMQTVTRRAVPTSKSTVQSAAPWACDLPSTPANYAKWHTLALASCDTPQWTFLQQS